MKELDYNLIRDVLSAYLNMTALDSTDHENRADIQKCIDTIDNKWIADVVDSEWRITLIKEGSVIQITADGMWKDAVMVVDEVKPERLLAYLVVPEQGTIYVHVNTGDYKYIGETKLKTDGNQG